MLLNHGSVGGLALLSLALGCTETGRSLIPVDVSVVGELTSLAEVRVVVVEGAIRRKVSNPEPWRGETLHFGVYVPKDVSGPVSVVACGYAVGGAVVNASSAANPTSVDVVPGKESDRVVVTLSPDVAPPSVCLTAGGGGGMGGGGAGGGGSSGTGGTGGYSGGGGLGAGGITGGAGIGGVAGTTAVAGTTGAAGTGIGGRGGSGGTGGVRVPTWGGAVAVGANPAISERLPAAAMDSLGNAAVVYMYGSDIWATHYNASTGLWSTPAAIDGRSGDAGPPAIAVDNNGNYTAVWSQTAASIPGIWQSTSTDGEHWSAPATITTVAGSGPVIAMNADGAAVVAWTEGGGAYQAVAATRPSTGAAWSAPQVMRPGEDNGSRIPAVAMSGTGEAFVGWEQVEGGSADRTSIWMRQHTSAGWNAAMLLETYDMQACYTISIAANRAGAAIVTWIQVAANGGTLSLQARRYLPSSGFSTVTKIAEGTDIDWNQAPALTLDEAGVATIAWGFSIQGRFNLFVNRATPSEAWPSPMAMETDNEAANVTGDALASSPLPAMGMDSAGNLTLIWRKRKGTRFDLWTRRLPAGGTWTPEQLLETRDTKSVFWPALAVGSNGNAIAVWNHESEGDIWANILR